VDAVEDARGSADYKRELVRISLVRGAGPGLGRARGRRASCRSKGSLLLSA